MIIPSWAKGKHLTKAKKALAFDGASIVTTLLSDQHSSFHGHGYNLCPLHLYLFHDQYSNDPDRLEGNEKKSLGNYLG